jgi:hypothetical protein
VYTNKIVLDEALHEVRGKIIRSIAGTACVLGAGFVIATTDILRANVLTAAFTSRPADAKTPAFEPSTVVEIAQEAAQALAKADILRSTSLTPAFAQPAADAPSAELDAPVAHRMDNERVPAPTPSPSVEAPAPATDLIAAAAFTSQPIDPTPAAAPAPAGVYVTASVSSAPAADPFSAGRAIAAPSAVEPVLTVRTELPQVAPLPKPRSEFVPPPSPAERLELTGKERAKAERCLAQAIYFEARNEPVRGQTAVAQVVLNRVFSPYYPDDVCSVVYQNAHRMLSCQFTFACDGQAESVRERGPWARAQRIAKQTLDGKVWLPEVGKSTHYHAAYVRPNWVREMKKMARHGLHTFYRPHRWGDGSNEPAWGLASVKKRS